MAWGDQRTNGDDVEDDEGEDELDENDYKAQKDAILFALHVSKSMLKPPPPGEDGKKAETDSGVAAALKSAYQIMQQRIIAQPKDKMGILLFGTETSKFQDNEGDWPHCYLLTDLNVPEARDVRTLRDLVDGNEDVSEILKPSREPVSMTNVFFCAARLFTINAPNYGSRRLFIITDDDEPHAGDKAKKMTAATKAKDLYDLGVVIELFPITRHGKEFDLGKFYDDIVYQDPTAEPDHFGQVQTCKSGDGLTLLSSLVSNINSKQTPKRALFSRVSFEIAPGLEISVKGYVPIHKQTPHKSCYIWTGGEEMQVAHGESVQLDGESKRTVEKVEFKKAFKFGAGGDHIYFSDEELKELKNFGPPVIRVIGFKPRSSLPSWASVKPSIFIFPSEEHFVGSTRVFSALWQKLIKDERIGIAWFIARSNSSPVYVAVVPSLAPTDEDCSTPFLPAGLWLCPLPFADDVRNVELPQLARAPDALIDPMREIIQNLQLPKAMYNPGKYPNPALQWHYRILQALALEDEPPEPEEAEDLTVPRYRQINKRVGGATAEWREELLRHVRAPSSKRKAGDDDDAGPPGKRKKQNADAVAGGGRAAGGDISKMRVTELRQELANKGLPTDGLKAALMARLADAMGKE